MLQCYADQEAYEAAVVEQTGGVLLEAGEQAPAARAGGVQPMATYVLATFYKDANFGGATLNITSSYATMCTTHSYKGNLTGGWNDAVSSVRNCGTCKTALYQVVNQLGASVGPAAGGWTVTSEFNDTASSYWVTG